MTLLARLIAQEEGFGIPGALPTRRNNPGDLRHAPNASHNGLDPDAIGQEPTVESGWEDLEHQLQLYAQRGMTIAQMVNVYAPQSENNTQSYLDFICQGLSCTPDTLVSDALLIP